MDRTVINRSSFVVGTEENLSSDAGLVSSSDVSPFQKTISATCGALVTSLVTTPLEVVKTRLQTVLHTNNLSNNTVHHSNLSTNTVVIPSSSSSSSRTVIGSTSASASTSLSSKSPKIGIRAPTTSSLATLIAVARMEGFRSLWSGLSAGLLMQIPSTVLYFTAYDELKNYIEKYGRQQRYYYSTNTVHNTHSSSSLSASSPISSPSIISTPLDDENIWERYAPLISGIFSRVLAVTIVSPLELLRTKAMYHGIDSPRLLTSIQHEISTGGYASLWRGLGPTLLRDVPFSGIYWYGYERIKKYIIFHWYYLPYYHQNNTSFFSSQTGTSVSSSHTSRIPSSSSSSSAVSPSQPSKENYTSFVNSPSFTHSNQWITSFLAGLFAGTFAAFITTPFDVVKTRKQVQMYRQQQQQQHIISSSLPSSSSATTSTSSIPLPSTSVPKTPVFPRTTTEILSMIIKEEGIKGLFAGLNMRVARVGPACAIMISSYELGKYIFAHNRSGNHNTNTSSSSSSSSRGDALNTITATTKDTPLSSLGYSHQENDESMISMNTVEE